MTKSCYNLPMNKRKKTILIVDDTDTNIDILVKLLEGKYDVIVSLSGHDAIEAAKNNRLDLHLLYIFSYFRYALYQFIL